MDANQRFTGKSAGGVRYPERCCAKGCERRPLWAPIVKIWAKGYPTTSTPLRVEVGMGFCEEHKGDFKVSDIPDLGKMAEAICKARRMAAPDINSAEVEMEPLIVA